jgi:hypothetical protein
VLRPQFDTHHVAGLLGTVCRRTVGLGTLGLVIAAFLAPNASASEILTRNATNVSLSVNEKYAVVHYTQAGKRKHVLVWGAVNAREPNRKIKQVAFKVDYSGGWGTFRKAVWKTVRNKCRPYDGPPLVLAIKACKAPDGSYWALQVWQRMLPNLGMTPWLASQKARELHISHWTGPLPVLDIYTDWVYSRHFHHLFGTYKYKGLPVHGFTATPTGSPLDTYGRNVFVDTYNSAYGPGWKRENSFLAHNPRGNFCYGFYQHERYAWMPPGPIRPEGNGQQYRVRSQGPGVTPIVQWSGPGLEDYDAGNPDHVNHELAMQVLEDQIHGSDPGCTAR